jgi:hypothetical protein
LPPKLGTKTKKKGGQKKNLYNFISNVINSYPKYSKKNIKHTIMIILQTFTFFIKIKKGGVLLFSDSIDLSKRSVKKNA